MADEQFSVEFVLANLKRFLGGLENVQRSLGTVQRSVGTVNRTYARMGGKVSKINQEIIGEVQDVAKQLSESADKQAQAVSKIVTSLKNLIVTEEKIKEVEKRIELEREKQKNKTVDQLNKINLQRQKGSDLAKQLEEKLRIASEATKKAEINAETAKIQAVEKTKQARINAKDQAIRYSKALEIAEINAASKVKAAEEKTEQARINAARSALEGQNRIQIETQKLLRLREQLKDETEESSLVEKLLARALGITAEETSKAGVVVQALLSKLWQVVVVFGVIKVLGGAVKLAIGGIKGAFDLLKKAVQALLSPLQKVGNSIKSFFKRAAAVATGVLLRDVIFFLMRSFKEMAGDIIDVAASFQQLEVRFETLLKREAGRMQRAGIDIGDAYEYASRRASELLEWSKRLSLQIPIDVKDIANTVAYAQAMGFASESAKVLSKSIFEYVTAAGFGSEVTERIIFNLGQMKLQGKITSTEMRDLARGSFFPLEEVLREAADMMGVTAEGFQEFRKAAAEGKIAVDVFTQAFVNLVDRDLAGVVQRMGRTFTGAIERLKNFFRVIVGGEILGPTLARIGELLGGFLDRLAQDDRVIQFAKVIGGVLLKSFNAVNQAISTYLLPALKTLLEAFGLGVPTANSFAYAVAVVGAVTRKVIQYISILITKFANFITGLQNKFTQSNANAQQWGYNIVASVAKGMAAALKLIVKVINAIGRILKFWLSPGSPPRVAPELTNWGLSAMHEYLRGFTQADFDVLQSIQSPLRDALSLLVDTGSIGERVAGELYASISLQIAKALSGATVDIAEFEAALARIQQVTGPFGKAIADLARKQLELAQAIEAVKAAEEALEAARRAEEAARTSISEQVREYNKLIRQGVDKASLNARLAEINATEEAARIATEQRKEAENTLEQAKEQVEVLQEQVKLLENIVKQLIDISREQIIKADASGVEDAISQIGDQLDSLFPIDFGAPDTTEIEEQIDSIFDEADKAVDDFFITLENLWEQYFGEESEFGRTWKDLEESLGGILDTFLAFLSTAGTTEPLEGFTSENVYQNIENQRTNIEKLAGAIGDVATGIASVDWTPLVNAIGNVDWQSMVDSLVKLIDSIGAIDWTGISTGVGNLVTGIATLLGVGPIEPSELLFGPKGPTAIIGGSILDRLQEALGFGVNNLKAPETNIGEEISSEITNPLAEIGPWIVDNVTFPIENAWNNLATILYKRSIIPEMVAGIMEEFTLLKTDGLSIWNEISVKITEGMLLLSQVIISVLGNAILASIGRLDSWRKAFDKTGVSISNLTRKVNALADAIRRLDLGKLQEAASAKICNIKTGLQHGGRAQKGVPTIVGEKGWEVFIPNMTGWILNQQQLARAMAVTSTSMRTVASGGVAHSPGGVSHVVNFNMGGMYVSNDIDSATLIALIRTTIRQEFS